MAATLYVTRDWSRFVDEGSSDAAFVVAECDIDRLGLRDAYDDYIKPKTKAVPKPANKMARKARNK